MPVRFETSGEKLQVVQSFDFPAIYLDHWAIRRFSSDTVLRARFLSALKESGGALILSHTNLAEITGPADHRQVDEIDAFLESALPNIYFAMFDIKNAIAQESGPR